MVFSIPEGLAPEVYPMAWLVGSWRGEGVISYPSIPETRFVQDVTFSSDGGPYLRYEATIRLPDEGDGQDAALAEREGAGATDPEHVAGGGRIWSTESGYWRVAPERPEGLGEDKTPIEVLTSDPAGHLVLYVGAVGNGRIDLVSDLIARTPTAAEVSSASRMYGLVEGTLMWVWEISAFGQPLQSYASAQLLRQDA